MCFLYDCELFGFGNGIFFCGKSLRLFSIYFMIINYELAFGATAKLFMKIYIGHFVFMFQNCNANTKFQIKL